MPSADKAAVDSRTKRSYSEQARRHVRTTSLYWSSAGTRSLSLTSRQTDQLTQRCVSIRHRLHPLYITCICAQCTRSMLRTLFHSGDHRLEEHFRCEALDEMCITSGTLLQGERHKVIGNICVSKCRIIHYMGSLYCMYIYIYIYIYNWNISPCFQILRAADAAAVGRYSADILPDSTRPSEHRSSVERFSIVTRIRHVDAVISSAAFIG